jgi:stage V sporulation protein AE
MNYFWAFVVGGGICVIGQLLIDLTGLTPARILTGYVVAGVILSAVGWYAPLAEFAGCGATVPLLGFGHLLAKGVRTAIEEEGAIGILTGMSQGHVAIVMPIVAGLMPGSLDLAGVAMVFGVAGQMITPTHVCLTITIDYFKSDFFKTLVPVILAEAIVLVVFSAWTWLTWTA